MRSVFYPKLVDGAEGDPTLYVRLAHRQESILFDCGSLANLPPREISKIRHLFISHTHVDHFIDFDRLVRFFLYTDQHLNVFGPQGLARQVGNRLASYTWNLVDGYPFEITVNEWADDSIDSYRFRARNEFRPEEIESVPCPDGRLLATPAYHVTAVPLEHGSITSLGLRVGNVAYCCDVGGFPDETVARLQGLDVLIIDALQYRTHPSHFSLGEALQWAEQLQPNKTVLTHMHVPLDYATVAAETPDNVEPAYDMMVIEQQVELADEQPG